MIDDPLADVTAPPPIARAGLPFCTTCGHDLVGSTCPTCQPPRARPATSSTRARPPGRPHLGRQHRRFIRQHPVMAAVLFLFIATPLIVVAIFTVIIYMVTDHQLKEHDTPCPTTPPTPQPPTDASPDDLS